MPFVPVPLDLPPDVVELRVGDADADGHDELVAISKRRRGAQPDAVSLTVLDCDDSASVIDRWSVDLTNKAMLIDIEEGLWAIGPKGLMALERDGVRTAVEASTALSGLGRTAATFADVFSDVDGDGTAEAVIARAGSVRVLGVDGVERARAQVRSRGELEVRRKGGTQIVASTVSPTWSLNDFDGDGVEDLLLPEGAAMTVISLGKGADGTPKTVRLPLDISPRRDDEKRKKGVAKKRVISVWLEDVDGDGKTDFTAQLWVTKGSWLGSEGEIVFARGTGEGFELAQSLASDRAVLIVRLIDVDGDGDKELTSAEMDFGVGNLTRALLTQKIKVELMVRRMTSGVVGEPETLHSVVVPISNDREPPVELERDLTGDGLPDMVTAQGSKEVKVFKGTGSGYDKTPLASLDVGFVQGEDKLWVGDITGDDRADIVVWKARSRSAKVLMLKD